jgi:hypothetical protein
VLHIQTSRIYPHQLVVASLPLKLKFNPIGVLVFYLLVNPHMPNHQIKSWTINQHEFVLPPLVLAAKRKCLRVLLLQTQNLSPHQLAVEPLSLKPKRSSATALALYLRVKSTQIAL